MEHIKHKNTLGQIYFYIVDGCNLNCRHCWIAPVFSSYVESYSVLAVELFNKIIEQAIPLGLQGVKLTGGEPLLHPQIIEILDIIKSEGLDLTVETNGVLCTPDVAQKISECRNAFVSVSVDGVNSETHEWVRNVKGCFNDANKGIKNLTDVGIKPQIIMSVMRRNKSQIESMVHLAELWGCSSVKFNVVQPTVRGENIHRAKENLSIEELIALGKWVENDLSTKTKLRLHYGHPIVFRSLEKILKKDSLEICGIMNLIGVLADGSYALCGIGNNIPELVFGHANNDKLEDVWENNKVLVELRNGLPDRLEGICGECLMKNICFGKCIAQNYYTNKNLWSPNWYCREAHESSMFPESRLVRKK
ncbi:MAG: SynChlorMet cassette radical SAM/SPASM protein ScmF [Nitrospirae bacterium]|nr:SynChlorMet cassette radical SAM/SPASM protein ScmF [Nitrospirota bacterium]